MLLETVKNNFKSDPGNPTRQRQRLLRRACMFCLTMVGLSLCFTMSPPDTASAEAFASPYFQRTWSRSDLPVMQQAAQRSFVYGPEGFHTSFEPYADSPNGVRLVQYFDKSRMEITRPDFDKNNQFYVTNGLLVKEMVQGNLQLGDRTFQARYPAYDIPVAGDPSNNPDAATYGSFTGLASTQVNREEDPRVGQPVTSTIGRNGQVSNNAALGGITTYAYYDPTLHHNIAKPFWDYINKTGIIFDKNGNPVQGLVFDWLYTVGLPITEAFWTVANVGGVKRDVLVQLFERRVLTFTPSNPVDYQVEMGNVGRHYYNWRYDPKYDVPVTPSSRATINPSAGFPGSKFVIRSDIFLAGEGISVALVLPSGQNVSSFDVTAANEKGELVYTITSNPGADKGEYSLIFDGSKTGNRAIVFFRLIGVPGINQ